MDTIETKSLGTLEGFDIEARIVPDDDAHTDEDWRLLDRDARDAYDREEWSYVGTIITASREGIELGSASLWGSEYGLIPGVWGWVSPLNGTGIDFVNGYGPDLIAEAIAEAKATLARLTEV